MEPPTELPPQASPRSAVVGCSTSPDPKKLKQMKKKFKPYQLKPKRGTNVEPPTELPPQASPRSAVVGCSTSPDPKKLKQMKKKLDELNRKIRHVRKKHNDQIHKLSKKSDRGA